MDSKKNTRYAYLSDLVATTMQATDVFTFYRNTPADPIKYAVTTITAADLATALGGGGGAVNPTSGYLPYNNTGTFADSFLFQDATDLHIVDTKFLSSANGQIQQDFGSGISWQITTDAGIGLQSTIYIDLNQIHLTTPAGYINLEPTYLLLNNGTQITFTSPLYNFSTATLSTVPYFDSLKNLVSSAVTPTELGYLSGATSNIQIQINGLLPGTGWALLGNAGTNPATDFIGTTDAVALHFRVNNQPSGIIDPILNNTALGYTVFQNNTIGT